MSRCWGSRLAVVCALTMLVVAPTRSAEAASMTITDPAEAPTVLNRSGARVSSQPLDIVTAMLTLGDNPQFSPYDDRLFVSVARALTDGNPVDDWGEPGQLPVKRVRWHLDTDFDGVDNYVIVYTPRQPAGFRGAPFREYDVIDAKGAVTCTGRWFIDFDQPFPAGGMFAEMSQSCIGSPSSLQWYVDSFHHVGAKVAYEDRAPDVGWAGPVSQGTPTRFSPIDPASRVCFAVAGDPGDAAIVNLVPVQATGGGFGLLVSSDVTVPPVASNVNFGAGTMDPNVAIAPIGADGKVCYTNSDGAAVHLVADHLGTIDAGAYTPATASGAPERKLDTRRGISG